MLKLDQVQKKSWAVGALASAGRAIEEAVHVLGGCEWSPADTERLNRDIAAINDGMQGLVDTAVTYLPMEEEDEEEDEDDAGDA